MTNRRDFIKNSTLAGAGLLVADSMMNQTFANAILSSEESQSLRFRQIHLDFHTHESIQDIATQFDPEEFAATLKKASVNSVTCFARCHHGYIYYDTKNNPERHHPFLKRNLLKEQIEACHKLNIRVPVYTTVQWDKFSALKHPEWLIRDEDGKPYSGNQKAFDAGFYEHLDVMTSYRDFLKEHITDLFESVPVDGVFFDIFHVFPNANFVAVEAMIKQGLNPAKEEVRYEFYKKTMREFKQEFMDYVKKLDKKAGVFFNGGHIGPSIRPELSSFSHLELESLPSGGWGYLHFPLTSRYARNLGKDIMGMTGKFHTSWGDFHSLKNQAALEFETFSMLALNAKCSIGDQLHPKGKLDGATYDLIGNVFGKVAQKEPWCEGAKAKTDIALFSSEEYNTVSSPRTPEQMMGAIRMLQEGKHQFDIIDSYSELSDYKVIIMPDSIPVNDSLKQKLENYTAKGGSIIASFQSGLTIDKKNFAVSNFGISLVGDAPFSPDFIALTGEGIGKNLPQTELVMYLKGMEIKPTTANILANANVPYFNRTWEHFNSHRHTPSTSKIGYPAVTQNGKNIYFAHPIFTMYAQNAPRWCREIFLNALEMLLPEPLVKMPNAPTAMLATLNEQKAQNRQVLHVLYYVPERRGSQFDVIEDIIPIYNTKISIKTPSKPSKLTLVPENKPLTFDYQNGRVVFVLPELRGHQMVEIR